MSPENLQLLPCTFDYDRAYEFATTVIGSVDNIGGRQQTAKFKGAAVVINENGTLKIDYIKK